MPVPFGTKTKLNKELGNANIFFSLFEWKNIRLGKYLILAITKC